MYMSVKTQLQEILVPLDWFYLLEKLKDKQN